LQQKKYLKCAHSYGILEGSKPKSLLVRTGRIP
jgi:hypothetical protein